MAELVSIKNLSFGDKLFLLKELGYGSDGIFVTDKGGVQVQDRYLKEPVRIDNMLIFPGSILILDDNPLSIASYLEEFPDAF